MGKLPYRRWLDFAKEDLNWTKANLKEKVYYGACFTAAQAAEKALKAYLLYKGKVVRKIHDLGALLEECREQDSSFQELRSACVALTDYYVKTRYPDISEFMEYTEDKAREALILAEKIIEFVEEKISSDL